jgi:hypothetical protein
MCESERIKTCAIISLIVTGIAIFLTSMGWVIDGTIHRNDPLENPETVCGVFTNVSYIKLEKNIFKLWHWTYRITTPASGTVTMRCPTVKHDLDVHFGGAYVGRTDGKVFSLVSEIDLLDCHNNKKYTIRTGNAFETIINQNKIMVSLEVRVGSVTEYYVDKLVFFTDDIDLFNRQGVRVANLKRNKYNDLIHGRGWTWDINIMDPINTPIDPFILISIAGEHSFSEPDNDGNDKYDTCNEVYRIMWIIMFVIVGVLGLGIILCLYVLYSEGLDYMKQCVCIPLHNLCIGCRDTYRSCKCRGSGCFTDSRCVNNLTIIHPLRTSLDLEMV